MDELGALQVLLPELRAYLDGAALPEDAPEGALEERSALPYGHLRALDDLVHLAPVSDVTGLAALLRAPLTALLDDDEGRDKSRQISDLLMVFGQRIALTKKLSERLRQVLLAQRHLSLEPEGAGGKRRRRKMSPESLMTRPFFPDALNLFEIHLRAHERPLDDVETWYTRVESFVGRRVEWPLSAEAMAAVMEPDDDAAPALTSPDGGRRPWYGGQMLPRTFALALGALTAPLLGCPDLCMQDSDCRSDQTCFMERCYLKSQPRREDPATCGAQCAPGTVRCRYLPLSDGIEECYVADDGCSAWRDGPECRMDQYCDGTVCQDRLGLGADCTGDAPCQLEYTCVTADLLSPVCLPSCFDASACGPTEICAYGACISAALCDGCDPFTDRCAANVVESCETIDGECRRWVARDDCGAVDVCQAGVCIGTVPAGGACSDEAHCLAGLVCLTDTQRCNPTCTRSGQCGGGQACRITRASQGQGICADAGGPTVEARCVVVIEGATAPGSWDDIGLPEFRAPDLYVQLEGPGFSYTTGTAENAGSATWNATTPPQPFGVLAQTSVRLLDADLVGVDTVGSWRLAEGFDWSTGAAWSFVLLSGDVTLSLRVECN
jgi:hypothetical protein